MPAPAATQVAIAVQLSEGAQAVIADLRLASTVLMRSMWFAP